MNCSEISFIDGWICFLLSWKIWLLFFWCCIWFVILCFAFTHWQYLSTWSSKTAMSDAYDLLLWSRSSFFSFFIMSVCWATLISALLITVLEWTLIKESYCYMFTFACNKRTRFKKPNLSNGFFGATNLPQVTCFLCNSGHDDTIKIRKCTKTKTFTVKKRENKENSVEIYPKSSWKFKLCVASIIDNCVINGLNLSRNLCIFCINVHCVVPFPNPKHS